MSWSRASDATAGAAPVERPVERELATLVAGHYPRLIRLAGLICDRVTDAEDAVQAALEQAWRRRGGLRDVERLQPWLDRIVVREAIRVSRRRRGFLARFLPGPREIHVDADDGATEPRTVTPDPSTRVALRIAYDRLPAPQRAVVALHLHAGYSVAETAAIVGVPIETVRSRLRLARERLREQLREDEP
jgi:RNA polymerase sigma-70 factor (ECF subfamily)